MKRLKSKTAFRLATAAGLTLGLMGGCPNPDDMNLNGNDNGSVANANTNANSSGANTNDNSSQRAAPRIEVDAGMIPQGSVPLLEDGQPRPLACASDKSGIPVDFVVNELILMTDEPAELDAFLARWNGTILREFDPSEAELDLPMAYLIRVETASADRAALAADLEALFPDGVSDLVVSSDAAADLVAVAAEEAARGMTVGLNYLMTSDTLENRTLTEGPTAANTLVGFNGRTETYDPNPFNWSYMRVGGVQNTGVAESWRLLERAGRLGNRIRIAVIDGGFAASADYPAVRSYINPFGGGNGTEANPLTCTGGGACPWHGLNVSDTVMGRADNSFGAAGVAGPIAEAVNIKISTDTFDNLRGVTAAVGAGARIINMSFGARVPAMGTLGVLPFDRVTSAARARGVLLFAAAGNNGQNIDEEDCFLACWEEAWWTPAENGGVIAVGSMDLQSTRPRNDSNSGTEELDIYGPGYMWVGPDPRINQVHAFGATSGASPFVAGCAALIWAANPALNANDVERILYETCNTGSNGAHRWPNAFQGVRAALGGNAPPEIQNMKVERQGFVGATIAFTCDAADLEDGEPRVEWYSDRIGLLGTGESTSRGLGADFPYGRHVIRCVAIDAGGARVEKSQTVEFANNAPRVSIEAPLALTSYFAGQTAFFEAYTYDIEDARQLPDDKVSWSSNLQGALGSGNLRQAVLTRVGNHVITLTGTDNSGTVGRDTLNVTVLPAPPDGVPPTAFINLLEYEAYGPFTPTSSEFTLIGSGVDAEDGVLPGTSLAWTLTSGGVTWNLPASQTGTFVRGVFSGVGDFTVTLTVTDSSGKTATHSRSGNRSIIR